MKTIIRFILVDLFYLIQRSDTVILELDKITNNQLY